MLVWTLEEGEYWKKTVNCLCLRYNAQRYEQFLLVCRLYQVSILPGLALCRPSASVSSIFRECGSVTFIWSEKHFIWPRHSREPWRRNELSTQYTLGRRSPSAVSYGRWHAGARGHLPLTGNVQAIDFLQLQHFGLYKKELKLLPPDTSHNAKYT